MAARLRKMDFEKLIDKGENPKGFTSQTANGTAHATGTGWNKQWPEWQQPEVEAGGAWQGRRSTRTGE